MTPTEYKHMKDAMVVACPTPEDAAQAINVILGQHWLRLADVYDYLDPDTLEHMAELVGMAGMGVAA